MIFLTSEFLETFSTDILSHNRVFYPGIRVRILRNLHWVKFDVFKSVQNIVHHTHVTEEEGCHISPASPPEPHAAPPAASLLTCRPYLLSKGK